MTTLNKQVKLGLLVLVPITLSMLFVGINSITNADQGDNLDLNQSESFSLGVLAYGAFELDGTSLTGDVRSGQIGGEDVSQDHLEIFSIRLDLIKPTDDRSGRSSGRIQAGPFIFTKRLDQTTPLLAQAFGQNQVIEGDVKIFENDPFDGVEQLRFIYRISQASILSIRTFTVLVDGAPIIIEEISLAYQVISWIDEINSVEYEYNYGIGA